MSSIYGDSIFESNLDRLYNHIIESSKLFEDFDIVTEAENNFKDKIVNAIKTVIRKVKEFFTWIKNKVIKFVKDTISKIKGLDLKKKLDNLKNKLKNKSNNESAILTEATLEQLENWLNSAKYDLYDIHQSSPSYGCNILDIINNDQIDVEIRKEGKTFIAKYTYSYGSGEEWELFKSYSTNIENFLNFKNDQLEKFEAIIEMANHDEKKYNDKIKELEETLRTISQKDIRSSEELIKALQDKKITESTKVTIHNLNCSIDELGEVTRACTYCINDIRKSVEEIDHKLSSAE